MPEDEGTLRTGSIVRVKDWPEAMPDARIDRIEGTSVRLVFDGLPHLVAWHGVGNLILTA